MTDSTIDRKTILPQELLQSFGTSAPGGDAQINSTKTERGSMKTLYCTGNAYVFGCFKTPIHACRGILLADGAEGAPAIAFSSDADTGIYRAGDGLIGITSNGSNVIVAGDGEIEFTGDITAPGNLVINPVGTSVDFTGHTLINVGGISLAAGSPNHVIINDGAGVLSSEAQLATTRGGTGQNTSAASGVAKVAAGTWSFAPITDGDFGSIANLTATQLTTTTIASPGDLTIAPTGGDVYYASNTIVHQVPGTIAGGDSGTFVENITTTSNLPVTLFSLPTSSGTNGTAYTIRAVISLGDATGGTDAGSYVFVVSGKNLLGVLSVGTLIQQGSILDGGLAATSVTADVSGIYIRVRISGLAATTIRWMGRFDVVAQQF